MVAAVREDGSNAPAVPMRLRGGIEMEQRPCIFWLIALLLVVLQGCGRREEPQAHAPAPSAPSAPPAKKEGYPPVAEAPEFPAFPWPPPQASTSALIDATLLRKPAPARTSLADVDQRLRTALDQTGYYERKYLSAPDGFALVTRLEQINSDGSSKAVPDRWAVEVGPLTTFDLKAYLRVLFRANPGRFRIIVFIVTPYLVTEAAATVTRPEAMDWLRRGAEALPVAIGQLEFSERYTCTALVYDFEKPDPQEEARFLAPSPLPGRLHLERAGLWHALGG